jgi:hypothetical protein
LRGWERLFVKTLAESHNPATALLMKGVRYESHS